LKLTKITLLRSFEYKVKIIETEIVTKTLELFSQHFILFVTYKWAQ
jgi:hypothetical protein